MDVRSSALGALYGLACGDALGMPTQSMSPDQIEQAYGGPVTGFRDAVDWQPIAPGMRAGSITDDTEQAVLLARRLIADDGDLDVHRYADDLIAWEAAMKAKGSLDLLGPSTKSALQALRDGESPEATGRFGTTNGGAMRAAPVGIAYPRTPELDAAARRSCIVTHNTVQGIEATTLIAYAVSCGIDGLGVREALAPPSRGIGRPRRRCWNARNGSSTKPDGTRMTTNPSPRCCARYAGPASKRTNPCPRRSPSPTGSPTTRFARSASPPRSAGTPIPSRPWPGR